jgi:hypothetical protein
MWDSPTTKTLTNYPAFVQPWLVKLLLGFLFSAHHLHHYPQHLSTLENQHRSVPLFLFLGSWNFSPLASSLPIVDYWLLLWSRAFHPAVCRAPFSFPHFRSLDLVELVSIFHNGLLRLSYLILFHHLYQYILGFTIGDNQAFMTLYHRSCMSGLGCFFGRSSVYKTGTELFYSRSSSLLLGGAFVYGNGRSVIGFVCLTMKASAAVYVVP